jgi:hypothetical protein
LVPVGVRRIAMAGMALRYRPLVQASRADSAGVEGMPFVAAGATPNVGRLRHPIALWATNARPAQTRTLPTPNIEVGVQYWLTHTFSHQLSRRQFAPERCRANYLLY